MRARTRKQEGAPRSPSNSSSGPAKRECYLLFSKLCREDTGALELEITKEEVVVDIHALSTSEAVGGYGFP
ncbi:hypothetical protein NDU88_000363 [Pleurodeles waltl]|uniref:Uncharacterized protein n=1 Tax=Pleurodeles waltl TaxID=8319 RepID=A0AAV7VUG7_PLEWA|nr:hypothetical protein NDU88_000363 [Pleurodeles waltl]